MPRPLWRRLLGVGDPAGATTALGRLYATRTTTAPTTDAVTGVLQQYGLSGPAAREACRAAFAAAVTAAVRDGHLDDGELAALRAWRGALTLSERDMREAFEAAAAAPLQRAIAAALVDEALTEEEKARLKALAANQQVSDALLAQWVREPAQAILQRRAEAVVSDRRLSPDEEAELEALAKSLNGVIQTDATTRALLDRYRLLWQVDNGILPTIAVPIALQRGERCHAEFAATWLEPRTHTTSVSYAGFSSSVRIVPGVRFRVGNVTPVRHTVDRLTRIDAGTLYVTSTRLILRGASRNITIRLSSVLSVEVYGNGVEIQKSRGRPPFVELTPGDVEYAGAVMAAVLANQGGG